MRRSFIALTVPLTLLLPSTASAQVTIDVAKITCEQFVLVKVADPNVLAAWFNGYYSAKRGTTTVDAEKLKENSQTLLKYCYSHLKSTLFEAIEDVFKTGG
jgi:acid stress chaperone HdeB